MEHNLETEINKLMKAFNLKYTFGNMDFEPSVHPLHSKQYYGSINDEDGKILWYCIVVYKTYPLEWDKTGKRRKIWDVQGNSNREMEGPLKYLGDDKGVKEYFINKTIELTDPLAVEYYKKYNIHWG